MLLMSANAGLNPAYPSPALFGCLAAVSPRPEEERVRTEYLTLAELEAEGLEAVLPTPTPGGYATLQSSIPAAGWPNVPGEDSWPCW